jgi:hypothetical protein
MNLEKLALQISLMQQRKAIEFAKENPQATLAGGWIEFGMYSITVHIFNWSDQREVPIPPNTTQIFSIDLVKLRQNPAYQFA